LSSAPTKPSDNFAEQIRKTGFVLENAIAQQLKAARWTVISNRYYVDDAQESVREIDLVAYRVSHVQHFDVYTALLISCKKSDSNAWALLCREIDPKDPNSNWQPLHAWSNDVAVAFQLAKPESARLYHESSASLTAGNVLRTPAVDVFAFQEMSKGSGAPKDDKAIFNATTSLMKAQAYELGALPKRRSKPAVYQFNLLSVVDTDLIRLFFAGDSIETQVVEQEHYVARYIIKKQATVSRIRFMRADVFPKLLPEYASLHQENCRWFDRECNDFYVDIVKDSVRRNALIAEFRSEVRWHIRIAYHLKRITPPDTDDMDLFWDDTTKQIRFLGPFGREGAKVLNEDQGVRSKIAAALKKIYRYDGEFQFDEDDIPF
jgi:hypothetical protein